MRFAPASAPPEGKGWCLVANERPLTAADLARILRVYLRIVDELPPDTETGFLDAQGHIHFLPDVGKKLRASREAAGLLDRIRKSESEGGR
ncbi:MAG TPA: hypothetical protein VMU87_15120 [Stellaceae bacterium]|nr:hypothetical protein [Stellaceae bacterium]